MKEISYLSNFIEKFIFLVLIVRLTMDISLI